MLPGRAERQRATPGEAKDSVGATCPNPGPFPIRPQAVISRSADTSASHRSPTGRQGSHMDGGSAILGRLAPQAVFLVSGETPWQAEVVIE